MDVRKFLPDGLSTEGHHIMNIKDNGEVVGTIWYEIWDGVMREAYLWDIFIDENRRGRGYGKKAMSELEESARKEGARRIHLSREKSVPEDGISGRSSHHDEVSLIHLHLCSPSFGRRMP